jgi:hypothetical protein
MGCRQLLMVRFRLGHVVSTCTKELVHIKLTSLRDKRYRQPRGCALRHAKNKSSKKNSRSRMKRHVHDTTRVSDPSAKDQVKKEDSRWKRSVIGATYLAKVSNRFPV